MSDSDFISCWLDPDDGSLTRLYYNITSAEWNCTEHYGKCDSCPKPQGDPDIAGIGVFISFLFSVLITACLSFVFTLLSTVQPRKRTVSTSRTTTMVYIWVGNKVANIIGREHAARWANICYDTVICLGDQQLVASIALLLSTIKKLHVDKTLTVYHFVFISGMVCLNSTAFTYAMICYRIRHQWDFADDLQQQHPVSHLPLWKRCMVQGLPWAIRVIFRLCLLALLLYNILVAVRMKDLPWDCPAICFQNNPGYGWISAIFPPLAILLFTIQSGITDCIQLTLAHNWWDPRVFLALMSNKIRSLVVWCQHQRFSAHETRRNMSLTSPSLHQGCFSILAGLFVVLWLSVTHYFCSLPMVTGLFVSLFKATLHVWRRTHIEVPERLRRLAEETKEEMEMGFGQTTALILIVLPILQIVISFTVHSRKSDPATPNVGLNSLAIDSAVDVNTSKDGTEEMIDRTTGFLKPGQYPLGPGPE